MENNQMNENNLDFLKQYLKDLYVLEMEDAYTHDALVALLKGVESINTNDIVDANSKHYVEGVGMRKYGENPDESRHVGFFDTAIAGFFGFGFVAFLLYFFDKLIHSFSMVVIVGVVGGILVGFLESKTHSDEIKKAQKEREHLKQELDNRVSQYMADKKDAINSTTATGNDIVEKKNKLYSLGIIYEKYRNLVAVSQFLDYLESGRCTKLTGPDGAYNLFESEMRQNIIIASLENINNNLGTIMDNQYMLYNALQENNRILSRIEDNTATIAYNTEIMSRNMEIGMRY